MGCRHNGQMARPHGVGVRRNVVTPSSFTSSGTPGVAVSIRRAARAQRCAAASGEKEAVKDGKVRTAAFAAVDRSGAGAAGVAPQLGAPSVLGGPGVGFDG